MTTQQKLAQARSKYWGWQVASKIILGIIYLSVVSEGLRLAFPVLSLKIHKMPVPVVAAWMAGDEVFHRFDAAHIIAFLFLFGVFFTWVRILREWLSPHEVQDIWSVKQRRWLWATAGIIILGADCFAFYYGVCMLGWGDGFLNIPALIGTVAYGTGLIICAFISLDLAMRVLYHKENDR